MTAISCFPAASRWRRSWPGCGRPAKPSSPCQRARKQANTLAEDDGYHASGQEYSARPDRPDLAESFWARLIHDRATARFADHEARRSASGGAGRLRRVRAAAQSADRGPVAPLRPPLVAGARLCLRPRLAPAAQPLRAQPPVPRPADRRPRGRDSISRSCIATRRAWRCGRRTAPGGPSRPARARSWSCPARSSPCSAAIACGRCTTASATMPRCAAGPR